MYLGFSHEPASYCKQIKHVQDMLEKDIDDDRIMLRGFYKPFLAKVIKLLDRYFSDPRNAIRNPIMTKFVTCLDDFLLMGNTHKFNIMRKMEKMMSGVLEAYTKDKPIVENEEELEKREE